MNGLRWTWWLALVTALGGCVLERGEVTWPGDGWAESGSEPVAGRPGAAVSGLREVPTENVAIRGQVAQRVADGKGSGQILVEETDDGYAWVYGMFEGPARDSGAVMLAPTLSLSAMQRAREGETVQFISGVAEPPPGVDSSEAEPEVAETIVCSGPRSGEWVEEATPEQAELTIEEADGGMERATLRFWSRVMGPRGPRIAESVVVFEYDPVLLYGEEAGAVASAP